MQRLARECTECRRGRSRGGFGEAFRLLVLLAVGRSTGRNVSSRRSTRGATCRSRIGDAEALGEHSLQENGQQRERSREADEERLCPREAHAGAVRVRQLVQRLPALNRDARRRRHSYSTEQQAESPQVRQL